jgi:F-type H+-transporting ATPase subunit b
VIQVNFTLFIQLINFLVLLFLLNNLLFKPVLAKIREREGQIRQDQEKATELDQRVQYQEQRHQEELAKARQTAAQEKNLLMAQAKEKEGDILGKARAEAARIVDNMKASIQAEAVQVRKTLSDEMTPLAQAMVEKILGRSV